MTPVQASGLQDLRGGHRCAQVRRMDLVERVYTLTRCYTGENDTEGTDTQIWSRTRTRERTI